MELYTGLKHDKSFAIIKKYWSIMFKLRRLILQIVAGIIAIWLAKELVQGVNFSGSFQTLLIIGGTLGLINFFLKPILNLITFPLKIITLGIFSIFINIGIVWIVDIFFTELDITGLLPLLWTTLIVWVLSLIASHL